MFGAKKKDPYESFEQKRRRIMSELGEKITSLGTSQKAYEEAEEKLHDWNDRLNVISSKSQSKNPETLAFLVEQAKINRDLAQETYTQEKKRYDLTIEVRKEAVEALSQLDRITLSTATQQAASVNREKRLQRNAIEDVTPVSSQMQRELDHAEYYIQALTELTLEK